MRDGPVTTDFDRFVMEVQGRVRRALTPVAGAEAARQATVDALVHAWGDWERVRAMANLAGYVYTVARSRLPVGVGPAQRLGGDVLGPVRIGEDAPGDRWATTNSARKASSNPDVLARSRTTPTTRSTPHSPIRMTRTPVSWDLSVLRALFKHQDPVTGCAVVPMPGR